MTTAEKYIYEVYKTKNFSIAAKNLFISQPALSASIKKYEERLGYAVFSRKTSPVTLTREGEVFIDYLKDTIDLEHQYSRRLAMLEDASSGTIAIGGSNLAAFSIIPYLCKQFTAKHPNVNIKVDVGDTTPYTNLLDKLENDTLDLVVASNDNSPNFESVLLWQEKYMVVIRRDYPDIEKLHKYSLTFEEICSGVYPKEKELTDWSVFKNIPVFKPGKSRNGWSIFADFFETTQIDKIHFVNFRRMDMQYEMMQMGLGAVIAPQSTIIAKRYNPDKQCCFVLSVPDNAKKIILLYKKESRKSEYLRELVEIARKRYSTPGDIMP